MADNKNKQKSLKDTINDMPHNIDAEKALLWCLLIDVRIQLEIASFIKKEDFYTDAHQTIFEAINDLVKENKPADFVTISDALEKKGVLEMVGGIDYLAQLTNVIPSASGYKRYLDIVQRESMLRKLIRGSADIIEDCQKSTDHNVSLSFAEKTIFEISESADNSEMVKINEVIPEVMNKFDELTKDKNSSRGVRTNYKGIDRLLNGLHKSDLIILAARPGVGKTSFSMNIVEQVALQGYSCAVFSLEMSKDQLVQRMLCSVAEVSMEHASKGQMTKTEWLKITKAKQLLAGAKIYIDDSAMTTPQTVLSKCRRLKNRNGLDLVMIDYVQLMTPDKSRSSDNRQQEITEISRTLKILAKEINVPVIALSQLSRAVETRKGRPQLSDLRESGAIEQDADIVMFIHRPDYNATDKEIAEGTVEKNVAEIVVAKHRNGPQGVVKLYFKGECTKFKNYDEETKKYEGQDDIEQVNDKQEGLAEIKADVTNQTPPPNDDDGGNGGGNFDDNIF